MHLELWTLMKARIYHSELWCPLPSATDVQNQTRTVVCMSESFLWLTVFDTVQI